MEEIKTSLQNQNTEILPVDLKPIQRSLRERDFEYANFDTFSTAKTSVKQLAGVYGFGR
jgi:hypothetical protein